jgi:aldehyde dehydrogenase (NAD+)
VSYRPLGPETTAAKPPPSGRKTARLRRAGASTTSPLTDIVPADWTYAPAPEGRDIVTLQPEYGLYVGGRWLEASETYTTIAPRDEEPLARIAQGTTEDVDAAVAAARDAFSNGWSALPGSERAKYLFRIARILQERAREFAVLESLNGGKPIKESRDVDLPLAAAHFFYYAGWADKLEYAFPNRRPKPVGVAGQIIPWNFPLLMLAWKVAPALACGNTVVLKPAETTPLTALLFCDVLRQAELPAGVVNIVTGDGRTGAAIVDHDGVDKIAFTGSTEVGKLIQRRLAGTGKKLTLELGGKAANIVFDDCALDQAVEGIVNGIYFNQGHVCCAGSRLFVQESIAEPLVEKLKHRLTTLRVGDPLDKNTDVGAINSRMQLEKIEELVAAGKEEGAEIYQPPCRLPEKGYWFAPTVFTNVAQSYRIAQEEIFGPVLSVLTFRTPDEAVEKANNTPYGLSAGVWTEKGSRILWMAQRMRAGVVWANTFNRFDPTSPFGGYKESGFGREGGLHGLEPYLTFEDSETFGG